MHSFRETCLELSIINIFINDLNDEKRNTLITFADNSVQERTARTRENRIKIQKRSRQIAEIIFKEKVIQERQFLVFRRDNTRHYTWGKISNCVITGWGETLQVGESWRWLLWKRQSFWDHKWKCRYWDMGNNPSARLSPHWRKRYHMSVKLWAKWRELIKEKVAVQRSMKHSQEVKQSWEIEL